MSPPDSSPAAGVSAYRSLLGDNQRFRNLFWAMLTSSMGDWIGVVAILALTEQILGPTRAAAFGISVVMVARIVPTLLLGPVAGVFVDRWDRKRTMIVTDIGRGVVMAMIAFAGDVFALILATLLVEIMATLFIPAKDSTLPNLVRREQLVQANQLSIGATYATFPLGGTLFALMVGLSTTFLTGWSFLAERPLAVPIWFNAVTFFASAVFISRISGIRKPRVESSEVEERRSAWEELTDGFRFIANQPLVRSLVVGVMMAFLGAGGVMAVGPLFASVLNAGDTGFGVLVAAVGFGLFGGIASTPALSRRLAKERLFAPGIGVAGVALIVAALMPRLDLATVPAFAMGGGAGVSFLAAYTLLQERTDDRIRGRTFAAFNTGVRMALFLSLVLAPALVGVIGLETAGVEGTVPYRIGGVRITLILGGLFALGGAVWSGRSIYLVLSAREALDLGVVDRGHDHRGVLVAFEGGEGAGKTTQIQRLREALEAEVEEVVVTREPGGTPIGDNVRALLLDGSGDGMTPRTEALLYAAARAEHVERVIRPALERGAVVLTDRFVDSSVVYQGAGRELGQLPVEELNRWSTRGLEADLVILLDIEAEEGLSRSAGSPPDDGGSLSAPTTVPGDRDRLESAPLDFHRAVNEAFRSRAAADPGRFLVLDARRDEEEIAAVIRRAVLHRLSTRRSPEAPSRQTDGETDGQAGGQTEPMPQEERP